MCLCCVCVQHTPANIQRCSFIVAVVEHPFQCECDETLLQTRLMFNNISALTLHTLYPSPPHPCGLLLLVNRSRYVHYVRCIGDIAFCRKLT